MPKDEFEWIKRHTPSSYFQQGLLKGIGDDAAVYREDGSVDQLMCVDTMVEGIHFRKDTMSPEDIGHKALAVNVSDIAAMGGFPVYYLVSIAIPVSWSDKELEGIYKGMADLAKKYKVDLIGGDTVSSPHGLVLSVTVHGRVEKGMSLYRKYARPGDYVFLTGSTGRSAAGLHLLLEKGRLAAFTEEERILIHHHQRPIPKVDVGREAARLRANISLNDISDGLASEVNEIAEASGTEIELIKKQIPVAQELHMFSEKEYWNWIFNGGEDFELVGTVKEDDWPKLNKTLQKRGYSSLYPIGRVKAGEPLVTLIDGEKKERVSKQGYNHFK